MAKNLKVFPVLTDSRFAMASEYKVFIICSTQVALDYNMYFQDV